MRRRSMTEGLHEGSCPPSWHPPLQPVSEMHIGMHWEGL